MSADPFIGEISMFAGNFPPRGWAFCNGQLLPIAQNTALFSILGTTYGGNGQTTFALPDLRGRLPLHHGDSTGPGLSSHSLGERAGVESVSLTVDQLPAHAHATPVATGRQTTDRAESGVPGRGGVYGAADATGPAGATTGGGQPHTNMPPYQAINFIIALDGIFPARN